MSQRKRTRRRTPEQGLGELGQAQMVAFFRRLGWPCDEIHSDYGEDLFVRVFEEGISTGLSFYAQVKSTDDFSRYRKKGNRSSEATLHYDIAVSDLRHWENSVPSVFLFLWNTSERSSYWLPIPEVISRLKKNPNWPRSKTIRLDFHKDFSCEKQGLELLRVHLLKHNFSSVRKVIAEDLALSFPETTEGDAELEQYREHLATGTEIQLDVAQLNMSDDARRLYGPLNQWDISIIVRPVPDSQVHPIRFEIRSPDGTTSMIPMVQMHKLESGTRQMTFVNGHPKTPFSSEIRASPLFLKLSIQTGSPRQTGSWHISTQGSRPTVKEAYEALPFLRCFLQGGEFRWQLLSRVPTDGKWQPFEPHPQFEIDNSLPSVKGTPYDPEFEGWLEVLCFISKRFGVRLELPDWRLPAKERFIAAEIAAACLSGRSYRSLKSLKVVLNPATTSEAEAEARVIVAHHRALWPRGGAQWKLQPETRTLNLRLLGAGFSLGSCTTHTVGYIGISPDELEQKFQAATKGKTAEFPITKVRETTIYHDFLPIGYADDNTP